MHEIGHALGLWHEQQRSDRDEFITVVEKNVDFWARANFASAPEEYLDNYDMPYDYNSVMHYGSTVNIKTKHVWILVWPCSEDWLLISLNKKKYSNVLFVTLKVMPAELSVIYFNDITYMHKGKLKFKPRRTCSLFQSNGDIQMPNACSPGIEQRAWPNSDTPNCEMGDL